MSIIDQRISKNKAVFDADEPTEGHFDRFQSKLQELHPETKKVSRRRFMPVLLKIAAVALILLTTSSILFNYPSLFQKKVVDDINSELFEMDQYYASLNQKKYQEIESIVGDDDDIIAMKDKAMHKVGRLQDNTIKLKDEYAETNKDERVYSALVSNYRMLSSALDKVINSMNEVKYKKTSN